MEILKTCGKECKKSFINDVIRCRSRKLLIIFWMIVTTIIACPDSYSGGARLWSYRCDYTRYNLASEVKFNRPINFGSKYCDFI